MESSRWSWGERKNTGHSSSILFGVYWRPSARLSTQISKTIRHRASSINSLNVYPRFCQSPRLPNNPRLLFHPLPSCSSNSSCHALCCFCASSNNRRCPSGDQFSTSCCGSGSGAGAAGSIARSPGLRRCVDCRVNGTVNYKVVGLSLLRIAASLWLEKVQPAGRSQLQHARTRLSYA